MFLHFNSLKIHMTANFLNNFDLFIEKAQECSNDNVKLIDLVPSIPTPSSCKLFSSKAQISFYFICVSVLQF